jgi:hypothetical protein
LEGINELFVEYMMGHVIPYNGAYFRPHPEELRKVYSEHEHALSITEVAIPAGEIEKKLRLEMDKQKSVIENLEKRVLEIEKVDKVVDLVLERLLSNEQDKKKLANLLGWDMTGRTR